VLRNSTSDSAANTRQRQSNICSQNGSHVLSVYASQRCALVNRVINYWNCSLKVERSSVTSPISRYGFQRHPCHWPISLNSQAVSLRSFVKFMLIINYCFFAGYLQLYILRWICRKLEGVLGTGWSWLRIGTGGGHL
jgi:hypothetical protein